MRAGFVVAIVAGLIIALYPAYAGTLSPYLWTPAGEKARGGMDVGLGRGGEEGGHHVMGQKVSGTVAEVRASEGVLVVDGVKVLVRGSWSFALNPDEAVRVRASSLLSMVSPGDRVVAVCKELEDGVCIAVALEDLTRGLKAWKGGVLVRGH